jgi:hypothetical protein
MLKNKAMLKNNLEEPPALSFKELKSLQKYLTQNKKEYNEKYKEKLLNWITNQMRPHHLEKIKKTITQNHNAL